MEKENENKKANKGLPRDIMTPEGILLLMLVKELKRTGILSENEGLRLTADFIGASTDAGYKVEEYGVYAMALGCMFDRELHARLIRDAKKHGVTIQ